MKRFFVLAGILIGVSAFFYFRAHAPEIPRTFESPLPGREEVCASGNLRLSMTGYEALRSRFPGVLPIDQVRIGLYAQWLRETRGQDPRDLEDAARCIRALMKPALAPRETRETELLLRRKFGVSSLTELKAFIIDAWRERNVEWNRSLVKEYGIEMPHSLGGNSG